MSQRTPISSPEKRESALSTPSRRWAVFGFTVAVFGIAGGGFCLKMIGFAATIAKDDAHGFGVVAMGLYLIGLLPIVFLTLWALFSGKFQDVESPKYRLLELHDEFERHPGMRRSHVRD
jgi:hypothetical protein